MEMEGTPGDFVVDTAGHCFICMKETVSSQLPSFASELGSSSPVSSSIYSLHHLSRYLKLRMRRVFNQEDLIPKSLLGKVERSTLKANLCEECASWTTKLSELYRKLEKIEIEAAPYLQLIHNKLIKGRLEGNTNLLKTITDKQSNIMDGSLGKLEVTDALRKETMERCSQKLRSIHPNVKVEKLTEARILLTQNRLKHSSLLLRSTQKIPPQMNCEALPDSGAEIRDWKWERYEFDVVSVASENSYLDDLGTQHEDSESEEKAYLSMREEYTGSGSFDIAIDTTSKRSKYQRDPKTGKLKCDVCLKTFESDASLFRHHQKVHLKIRFKCSMCDKVFTRKDNLKVHQASVHLKQQFNCHICSKSFATYSNKHRHIKLDRCVMGKTKAAKTSSKQQNYTHG